MGVDVLRRLLIAAFFLLTIGCSHPPPEYVSHYTPPDAPPPAAHVTLIADSYANDLKDRLSTSIGGEPVVVAVHPLGGSGYVNRGYRDAVFGNLVPNSVTPQDRLVVFFGSGNDAGTQPEVLASAARSAYSNAKQIAPQAKLLVIGPAWVKGGAPTEGWLAIRDVLRSEAAAAGAAFVDPIAEGWFVGQPQLIGPDHVHPNTDGTSYLVQKIVPLIVAQLH